MSSSKPKKSLKQKVGGFLEKVDDRINVVTVRRGYVKIPFKNSVTNKMENVTVKIPKGATKQQAVQLAEYQVRSELQERELKRWKTEFGKKEFELTKQIAKQKQPDVKDLFNENNAADVKQLQQDVYNRIWQQYAAKSQMELRVYEQSTTSAVASDRLLF